MKKRNLILGLAAMAMSAGALATVVAVNANEPAIQTKADISESSTIYLKPNSNWTQANARFAAYFYGNGEKWVDMTDEDKDGYYQATVPTGGYTGVVFNRMNPSTTANNWDNKWDQTADLDLVNAEGNTYTVADGAWSKGSGTWSITKAYKVSYSARLIDESEKSTIKALKTVYVDEGKTHTLISGYARQPGYKFEGWYKDASCNEKYDATSTDSGLTLYGKYTKLVNDSHFYVIPSTTTVPSWNVYSFDNEAKSDKQYGYWPGTALNDDMMVPATAEYLSLEGNKTIIYKVGFASEAGDTNVIVNAENGTIESMSFDLTHMNAVYWNGYKGSTGAADLAKGKAIDFALELRDTIYGASKGGVEHTVCGLTKDQAMSLVASYNEKVAGENCDKAYGDKIGIYTYEGANTEKSAHVTVKDIMVQVNAIANSDTNALNFFRTNETQNRTTGFVVAGVSVLGLVAVGGVFLLRKKKEN